MKTTILFVSRNLSINSITQISKRSISRTKIICDQINHHSTKNGNGIKNVGVIGGGVMGAGIAQVAAQNGFKVTVIDNDEGSQRCLVQVSRSLDILAKKKFPNEPLGAKKFRADIFNNITTKHNLTDLPSNTDLVIEAVYENLELKRNIFRQLDEITPPDTIYATNTSALCVQDISKAVKRPENFGGLHFLNPVWAMRLAEVVKTQNTSKSTHDKLFNFAKDLGKTPVTSYDIPGFIVNRLLFPYLVEALRFYERGHASKEDIDLAMKHGAGHPLGPFELLDVIGLDLVKAALDNWHRIEPDNKLFQPSEVLNKMVEEQKLGQKTMQGFYQYKHTLY